MQLYIIIGLIAATVFMLSSEKCTPVAASMIILVVLTLSGILTPKQTLEKLSDPTIMLFVGTFLVSASFEKVGLTQRLGQTTFRFVQRYAHSEKIIIFIIAMTTALASILLQALGVQMVMMTLVLTLADQLSISRKRALLALGYSATIGGSFTLLGNNLNLLAKSTYEAAAPGGSFGLFQMTPLTVPMGILLITFFCFWGMNAVKEEPKKVDSYEEISFHIETDKKKQGIVLMVAVVFIIFVALNSVYMPPNIVVILMAFALGLSGVMNTKEMLNCINWEIILFAVGITTLSGAVSKVGLDVLISDFARTLLGHAVSLRMVVAIVFIITTAMTQLMSNSGSFAIMVPIGITLSESLNLPLKPIIIAMCLAANSAFLTPLATPSYAMLASAGNIKFKEFFKAGLPMLCISALFVIVLVPIMFK